MLDASKVILLVEDNRDDAALTLRAFEASYLMNPISVARDASSAGLPVRARRPRRPGEAAACRCQQRCTHEEIPPEGSAP